MSLATRKRSTQVSHRQALQILENEIDPQRITGAVDQLLQLKLNKYQLKLNSKLLLDVRTEFENWLIDEVSEIGGQFRSVPDHAKEKWLEDRLAISDRRKVSNQPLRFLSDFLFQQIQEKVQKLKRLKAGNLEFRNTFGRVSGQREREKLILNYAAELGASSKELADDAKAFSRWFDEEAVTDRYVKQVGEIELSLVFTFDRLSEVIARVFNLGRKLHLESLTGNEAIDRKALHQRMHGIWKRLKVETRVQDALIYDGDDRVHVAALKFLSTVVASVPKDLASEFIDDRTRVFIHRAALEDTADVWIQCQALSVMSSLSFANALPMLLQRLDEPSEGDDIFVRRHALKLIEAYQLGCLERGIDRPLELSEQICKSEPSEFVRQKLAKVAFLSTNPSTRSQWESLVLNDEVEAVRAAALLAGIEVETDLSSRIDYLTVIRKSLRSERASYVLRVGFHCVVEVLKQVSHLPANDKLRETIHAFCAEQLVPCIAKLQNTHEDTKVRRWAAQSRQQIWASLDEEAAAIVKKMAPLLFNTAPGQRCRLPRNAFAGISEDKLGRVFAVLATADFGYDIHKTLFGYRILRGPSFGFRLWRMIFEFRNTATDKRQALRHTVGRISNATLRAPSQILGELSETKVPGEPLTIGNDGTWRPFMPLLDDFVSVLNLSWFRRRTVRFFTSQGETKVTGPRGIFRRLRAAWQLSFKFAEYATKRNWDEDSYAPSEFVQSLRRLGFEIEFLEYAPEFDESMAFTNVAEATVASAVTANNSELSDAGTTVEAEPEKALDSSDAADSGLQAGDDSVIKFFVAGLLAIPLLAISVQESLIKLVSSFVEYFASSFENTLPELVVFAGALTLFVFAKHFYSNYKFRKARERIPLSIGGWGTRGKSGTERLKAALIGVMGHGLVSKTTGCEAMFIHGDAHGEPLEIPLFRPYDKATIWEQLNLIRMASKMNPSVFLWECMALTPAFVDVLQRQWTCDDIGTITNTYPDHEDVQGPAGHNVATTISGFVPLNSHLLSTEEVMRPYVTESCRLAKTTFRGVGWLESGLVTDDVLDRFPYKEHPDNIALVSAMGDELGVDHEFCLKAMADYLVPDLGVLKTHPESLIRTRKIEFTNGCSANERFGCMGNWRRLGFDKQDPWEEPTTWISGVVNNRADRVPRSKVFAKIIVEDVNADRFFIIGSNLKGMRGFVDDAWDVKAQTISLRDSDNVWDKEFALKTLKEATWGMRQPIEESNIVARLKCSLAAALQDESKAETMASESWNEPETIQANLESLDVETQLIQSIFVHQTIWIDGLAGYRKMKSAIESSGSGQAEALERSFISLLKGWYDKKIVIVENFDATGEEVLAVVVDETPPGFKNRTMGLQNIKGTGLDFVYRFQAWDTCFDACEAAQSNQVQSIEKGLQVLIAMPEIGQLCQAKVQSVIEHGKQSKLYSRLELQTLLEQLEKKYADEVAKLDLKKVDTDATAGGQKKEENRIRSAFNGWLLESTEQFLDVHDSIHRRDKADLIYKDLSAGRISRQRAVVELRLINKRQKGGWYVGKKMKK